VGSSESADGHLGSPDRFQRYQQILADFSRMVADSVTSQPYCSLPLCKLPVALALITLRFCNIVRP
jgi:hypothetical protein